MKLGEALTVRKRQAEKLNDLNGRINANALTQEGDTPQEDANALIADFEAVSREHAELVRRINLTNQEATFEGRSLQALLVEKDHLIRLRNMLSRAATAAAPSRSDLRFMRTEIKFVPQLDVPALRVRIDDASRQINDLDLRIQEINWQVDIVT